MAAPPHPYLSFLLRLWPMQGEADELWRASLESPDSGERRGFADLPALFAFLQEVTTQFHQPTIQSPHYQEEVHE